MDQDPDAPFLRALENNAVFKKEKKDLKEEDTYLIKFCRVNYRYKMLTLKRYRCQSSSRE